ncbi:MAG: integrase core domain-containing protein [Thermodesulfobacteriota bacterium]
MPSRPRNRSGQSWKTFLKNHLSSTCAMDFFTVPTINFRILYVLIILSHDRRRVVHFNITEHPTAAWTLQQVREAFPWDTAPRFLLRDRDGIYENIFSRGVKNMGIKELLSPPRSPWCNGYAERVIGTIRRECLNHHIILNEKHLHRVLKEYLGYYHQDRTHLGLDKDTPQGRKAEKVSQSGKVISLPRCGGLHHRYTWRQAA